MDRKDTIVSRTYFYVVVSTFHSFYFLKFNLDTLFWTRVTFSFSCIETKKINRAYLSRIEIYQIVKIINFKLNLIIYNKHTQIKTKRQKKSYLTFPSRQQRPSGISNLPSYSIFLDICSLLSIQLNDKRIL